LTACGLEHWQTQPGPEIGSAGPASAGLVLATPPAAAVCLDPLDLLRPECCPLPLLGRTEELAMLEAWLAGASPVSVHRVVGRAGIGKTRLAIELCRRALAQGWSAGFASTQAVARFAAEVGHLRSGDALLVVIDRTQDDDALLVECCARLCQARHSGPLRLLLLEREPSDHPASRVAWNDTCSLPNVAEPIYLAGLRSPADRRALLGRAMTLTARAAGLLPRPPPASAALDSCEPLHLLLAALVSPYHDVSAALARSPAALAGELAEAELAKLERFASRQGLDPRFARHLIVCITLQDGCLLEAAPALIRQEAEAMGMHLHEPSEHVADCLADALLAADGKTLEPLGPAPIGEAFLVREVAQHSAERQAAIIRRALHRAHAATITKLRRTAELHGGSDPTHPALAWS
jgi:hypothetical protein